MVFTLQRYIFKELMKVFVLATIAFTMMLSFGSILKPVQEYGASPMQVIILLGCFMPVTLTFVLPISAIFAATLIYGRLASDNELDACRASGVSILTIVYPGLFLALMVSIITLILSFHIMPRFVHQAEKVIKADVKQMCFRNIQRKGFYTLPGKRYRLYADYADNVNGLLYGVEVIESKNNSYGRTIEAATAQLEFKPFEGYNEITVLAKNVFDTNPEGEQIYFETLPITYRFKSLLGDDIKFKKLDEIKKIQSDPLSFYPIQQEVDRTYAQLVMELIAKDITTAISDQSAGGYYKGFVSDNKQLIFTAKECVITAKGLLVLTGDISFFEYDDTQKMSKWQCNSAEIRMENENDPTSFVMTLVDAAKQRGDGEVELRFRPFFRGLKLPETVQSILPENKMNAIISVLPNENQLAILDNPTQGLVNQIKGVQRAIVVTNAEISCEINSRLVFGIGCILLILTGIGLGILLRGGHMLTAFGISMIPVTILVVSMMAGKNIAKNMGAQGNGILIMWAGLVALCFICIGIYRKLFRM